MHGHGSVEKHRWPLRYVQPFARPVALDFRTTPAARYATGRLLLGLAAASALLVTAGLLIRSGDWSPPTEADASSIDDVPFADLDAEAEAFVETERTP